MGLALVHFQKYWLLRENGRQKHRPLPTWSEIKPGHGEIFVGQQLQYYFGCYISTIIKGQLISEQIYGVLNFSKMQRNIRIGFTCKFKKYISINFY